MGRAFSIHGDKRNAYRILVGKPKWKRPLGPRTILKRILEKYDGVVCIGLIGLRIGTSKGFLWTWQWTLGFHKILVNFLVAEQLASFQERLSSMELVKELIMLYPCSIHCFPPITSLPPGKHPCSLFGSTRFEISTQRPVILSWDFRGFPANTGK
jgi:hypothetical protein